MLGFGWEFGLGACLALLLATLWGRCLVGLGFSLPDAQKRVGSIDGLRGYLAICVMLHHFVIWETVLASDAPWIAPKIAILNELGAGSVALFFMTTGLVFYPQVAAGFGAVNWPRLFVRRVFRIVPLVLISVMMVMVVIALRTGRSPGSGDIRPMLDWISTRGEPPLMSYPDSGRLNAYVLWSLWFEWKFYLIVLPLCSAFVWMFLSRMPALVVPCALIVFSFVAQAKHVGGALPTYLPLFGIGMLAREAASRERLANFLRHPVVGFAATLGLLFAIVRYHVPYGFALPWFAVFFTCVACGFDLGGVLQSRGARALGECSYGIYITHGLVLDVFFVDGIGGSGHLDGGLIAAMPAVLAVLSISVAAMLHVTVERPAIKLGRHIRGPRSRGVRIAE